MLDNRYALLFIRGERPVMDLKYDILKHPSVRLTTDGQADPYIHGEPRDTDFVLLSEEDVEKELDNDTLQAA